MASSCYEAIESIDSKVLSLLQVSTLGGETKTIPVPSELMWNDFKKLVEKEFNIPRGMQKLTQGDHVLEFEGTDCVIDLLEKSKLSQDMVVTVTCSSKAWFWADANGSDPSEDYRDHAASYKPLLKILEWLEDSHGEDTVTEDLGVGVIYVPGGEVPRTSEDILQFLSGSENHSCVVAQNEAGSEIACPWNDIEMNAVTISDVWPPRRAATPYYGVVTHYLPAENVAQTLACAEADTSADDVNQLVSQSLFFACVGDRGCVKKDLEPGSYFFEKYAADPHVFICANPMKHTIAFCFQCTYWD